jgi:hypothetical protein
MSKDKNELKNLLDELIAARREYDRLVYDEEDPQELGRPCSINQLSMLERKLGKPLPPSYRAFLELHNGWGSFDGDGKLLAVEDHESDWVKTRVGELSELFLEFGGQDPFKAGALPVMLGETIQNYLVLDPRTSGADGEMTFVSYDLTDEEDRFQDFTSYLRYQLSLSKKLIAREKEGIEDKDEDD